MRRWDCEKGGSDGHWTQDASPRDCYSDVLCRLRERCVVDVGAAARRGIRLGAALGQPRRRHMRRARFDDDVSGVDEACRGLRLGSARRDPHRSREH